MKRREEHQPRLLAWLLCLAMLLGMLPGMAWAEEKTETLTLDKNDWSVEFQYNNGVTEDATEKETLGGYVSMSSDAGEITMTVNTADNAVTKGSYYLYFNSTLENVKKIKITYEYTGNIYYANLFCFDGDWQYKGAENGEISFDSAATVNRIGFNVSSEQAINGTVKVTKVEVTTEESEIPTPTEHFITVKGTKPADGGGIEDFANEDWAVPHQKIAVTNQEQTITPKLEIFKGDTGSFMPVSVSAAKEDGTAISSSDINLSLDPKTYKITIDTTDVDYNIVVSVHYEWKNAPAPETASIISKVTIPNVKDEDVWFGAFEPTEIQGKQQTLSLKIEDKFYADSVVKVVKTEDGTDVTQQVQPRLDKTANTLSLDTTNIDYGITVVINYIWKDDGSGDEPAVPATGPDWTFDSDTQGWKTGISWGVTGGAEAAYDSGRLAVTSHWADGNSQVVLDWEPASPASIAGKNYLMMDVFYDASKLTSGALSIEPFAGAGEENLLQTVEPVSHWDGDKEETVTEITGLQGAALSSGEAASGGLTKQTLYFCFNARSASIPKMSLRINGTAANAYNGTLYLDSIRFGTAPGYIATTCSLDWKPEVFTPGGFVPILEREQTFRAKVTESGFELDKITISAQHGTPPEITEQMSRSGVVTMNTAGLSGRVVLSASYVWPPDFSSGGSSEPGYTPVVPGTEPGGSGSTSAGQGISAEVQPSVRNGGAYSEVSAAAVAKLISQAEKSKEPVKVLTIAPKVSNNSPLKVSEVTIQSAELNALGNKTGANLRIGSHIADITIANKTVSQLAEQEQAVSFATERNGNMVKVTVSRDGKPLSSVPGGIKVELHKPCNFYTAAYLVPDPDHPENRQPIPLSMASQDGKTMQVLLPGSGTVVLVNKQSGFLDMSGGTWGMGPVDFAHSHGIFNGDTSGRFRPNDTMTRAMMVQILYNFEGRPEGQLHQFADTKTGAWYAAAAGWAVDKGIVYGYADGSFVPGSTITRQQAVCFLYRWAGSPEADTACLEQFTDGPSVGKFAQEAMAWAAKNGILSGSSTTALSPAEPVTRYQAAQMVTNLVARQIAAPWSGKE